MKRKRRSLYGVPAAYNARTGKIQYQPERMRVGLIRVRIARVGPEGQPFQSACAGVYASVNVNGRVYKFSARTFDRRYMSYAVRQYNAMPLRFPLETATAGRAARRAWGQRLGVHPL